MMNCIDAIEKPEVLSALDVMVLLLNEGPITGFTRLDKMLYLISRDKTLKVLPQYEFEHANFGPYSAKAFDDLMALEILKGITTKTLGNFGDYIERVDEEFIERELDGEVCWHDYPLKSYELSEKVKTHALLMRQNLTCEQQKALTDLYGLWVHKSLGLIFNYIYSVYYDLPKLSADSIVYSDVKKHQKHWWQFWKRNDQTINQKPTKMG